MEQRWKLNIATRKKIGNVFLTWEEPVAREAPGASPEFHPQPARLHPDVGFHILVDDWAEKKPKVARALFRLGRPPLERRLSATEFQEILQQASLRESRGRGIADEAGETEYGKV